MSSGQHPMSARYTVGVAVGTIANVHRIAVIMDGRQSPRVAPLPEPLNVGGC